MKTVRRVSALLLAVAALAACSDDGDDEANSVPYQWIRSEYTAVPLGYVDPEDAPGTVADEIDRNTPAWSRGVRGGTVFLRYLDDIVAITPHARRGSQIEISDYRTGYHRWSGKLPSHWPHPDSDAFRGGGPGSGK
ncbi:DUF4247 domain-containing protein [Streptomyces sp. JNUCC 64]